jgi:predicted nucleic acid-binding protein
VIVLDTTVLVYAKGADHPLRNPCRDLIAAVVAGRIRATTTAEVIQEFVHVRARRRGREDAAALGSAYTDLLSPLLMLTEEHLRKGLALFELSPSLGAFDAVLAATALNSGARTLVSADAAFADIPQLSYISPSAAGVAALLSGDR